jgi:hypothetical protein
VGFDLTTDLAVVPDFVAAIKGVPAADIDPKENPFHQATDAFGRPVGKGGGTDEGEERQGITVFRFTTPTFVPLHGAPESPATERTASGIARPGAVRAARAGARGDAAPAVSDRLGVAGAVTPVPEDPDADRGQGVTAIGSSADGVPVQQFDRTPDGSLPYGMAQEQGAAPAAGTAADGGGDPGPVQASTEATEALQQLQPKSPDDTPDYQYYGWRRPTTGTTGTTGTGAAGSGGTTGK